MDINYYSSSRLSNSVNTVYIKAIRASGYNVNALYIGDNFKEYLRMIKDMAKNKSADFIFIGYDSPKLVSIARIFTRKKIIYNALCSVYERLIVSRKLASKLSLRAIYYWLLDFFAVNSANLVMLETDSQIDYFKKLFLAPDGKLFRAWTGVDEDKFFYNPDIKKRSEFTVVFRGVTVPESGAEFVVKAAKILENQDIKFIMLSNGMMIEKVEKLIKELKPLNLKLIKELLPQAALTEIIQSSNLSLGQLSDHERLNRTIPHKAYESLALKVAYLTAANKGILELLRHGETCLVSIPANEKSLADVILWAKNHPEELNKIAENGHNLYLEKLRPNILATEILNRIKLIK